MPNNSSRTNYIGPNLKRILEEMGNQIRLARLRRDYSVELIAKRAGISRATLWKIEKGDPSVAMGAYAKVLNAIKHKVPYITTIAAASASADGILAAQSETKIDVNSLQNLHEGIVK